MLTSLCHYIRYFEELEEFIIRKRHLDVFFRKIKFKNLNPSDLQSKGKFWCWPADILQQKSFFGETILKNNKYNSLTNVFLILILIGNWQDSRLSITPMFHSDKGDLNVCSFSFNLKPSTLSIFSMPNGRLFQLEIVAGKKEYLYESQFAWRCLNLKL